MSDCNDYIDREFENFIAEGESEHRQEIADKIEHLRDSLNDLDEEQRAEIAELNIDDDDPTDDDIQQLTDINEYYDERRQEIEDEIKNYQSELDDDCEYYEYADRDDDNECDEDDL